MFNHESIDKTPTVNQIKAIIDYMEKDQNEKYSFNNMMSMQRCEPNKIILDLNNSHFGKKYEILFINENVIISFKEIEVWMS